MNAHQSHYLIFHATVSGQALSWERGAWERRKEPGKFPSVRRRCLTRGWQPIYKWAPARANKSGDIRKTFHPADNKILWLRKQLRSEGSQELPWKGGREPRAPRAPRGRAHLGRVRIPEPSPAVARLPVTCAAPAAEPATVHAGPSAPRAAAAATTTARPPCPCPRSPVSCRTARARPLGCGPACGSAPAPAHS